MPREVNFQTRHALCLEILDEAGHLLRHQWIAGDDELGRSSGFRRELRSRRERYLLAVASNTLIRDLEVEVPQHAGPGGPRKAPFVRVDKWLAALPASAWTRIYMRDGEKGPLVVEVAARCRVQAKADGKRVGPEELFVGIRTTDESGAVKHDYYLSNAPPDTPPSELARVAKAEHRIEECLQRGKSECGLADYEVRSWGGWYHRQTLSLLAAWFLNCELRVGKKSVPAFTFPQLRAAIVQLLRAASGWPPSSVSIVLTHCLRSSVSTRTICSSTSPETPFKSGESLRAPHRESGRCAPPRSGEIAPNAAGPRGRKIISGRHAEPVCQNIGKSQDQDHSVR